VNRIQIQDTVGWTEDSVYKQTDRQDKQQLQNTRAGTCVAAACCAVVVAPKRVFFCIYVRCLLLSVCSGAFLGSFTASNIGCTYRQYSRSREEKRVQIEAGEETEEIYHTVRTYS
jgi:hypothetical protein